MGDEPRRTRPAWLADSDWWRDVASQAAGGLIVVGVSGASVGLAAWLTTINLPSTPSEWVAAGWLAFGAILLGFILIRLAQKMTEYRRWLRRSTPRDPADEDRAPLYVRLLWYTVLAVFLVLYIGGVVTLLGIFDPR